MEVNGYTGTVNFDGDFVTILRKGLFARMTVGKGDKRIPLRSLTAVQWKPAGFAMNGYIEFSIGGGNESRSKFGNATSNAVNNENAVVFTKNQMPEFIKLREVIEDAILNLNPNQGSTSTNNDPILLKQLHSLHEQGILSNKEYEEKKAELLKRL
jgi:hypothetical protein